jgi:hypothetical protein
MFELLSNIPKDTAAAIGSSIIVITLSPAFCADSFNLLLY